MNMDLHMIVAALTWLGLSTAHAADVKAGKAAADTHCIQCHEADDWDGESAASLESLIRDIVAGKVKHRQKIDLTPAEIENVAAYWGESSR